MKTKSTYFTLTQNLQKLFRFPGLILILFVCCGNVLSKKTINRSTPAVPDTTITFPGNNFSGADGDCPSSAAASSFTFAPASKFTAQAASVPKGSKSLTKAEAAASRTRYKAVPTITTFTPSSGPIGTLVTISGTNFDTVTCNNIVYFGDVKATLSVGCRTSLTAKVPAGATFKALSVTNGHFTAYSSKPYIVTFNGGGRILPASFIQTLQSPAAGGNSSVITGDLDADGKPDLVIANNDSISISICRNTSSGGNYSFATRIDYGMEYSAKDVSLVDLDGDGRLDMVATDVVSGILIFRNTSTNGNISFAPKFRMPAGRHPTRISTGDFDGDGRPDVAVGNIVDNKITLFRNTSSPEAISFGPAIVIPSGLAPATLSAADIDGDGKVDIVVTEANENIVSIFINTSTAANITFAPKVGLAGGLAPYGLAVGDMDGDGKTDIVVSNVKEGTYTIYKNESTCGTVSFAPGISLPGNGTDFTLCLSDMDGDGKLDIISLNTTANSVAVIKNNSTSGNLSFVEKVFFATGTTPLSVAVADINGDGKYDIISSNYNQSFTILKNNVIEAFEMYPHKVEVKLLPKGLRNGFFMNN